MLGISNAEAAANVQDFGDEAELLMPVIKDMQQLLGNGFETCYFKDLGANVGVDAKQVEMIVG